MGLHFFLGANSAEGFSGLYDQLCGGALNDLLIVKGGPGGGKSSLLRRIADAVAARGECVAYIHCSGDPQSLDGVYFPRLRAGAVDGTAPHVLEPTYAAAAERWCDVGRFCNMAAAKERRDGIVAHSDACRSAYCDAYRALRALAAVEEERRAVVRAAFDGERFLARAAGIVSRELRGRRVGGGREYRVFLGGLTHEGAVCRFDTVAALCPRVYALADGYGLGGGMLDFLRASARALGEDAVVCFDPLRPAQVQHLLLPGRGLAFVTELPGFDARPYRRLRLDAAALEKLPRAQRARLRFTRRVSRALEDEAVESLRRAKREHDALEALYNPLVDFDAVYAVAEEEAARFASYCDDIHYNI